MMNIYLSTNEELYCQDYKHIHGDIIPLINEAAKQIKGGKKFIKVTVEFDRIIGVTYCVKTTEDDVVFHINRKGRYGPSRMVKNREPEPCNKLTLVLLRVGNRYRILTAYIGEPAEPEVWDDRAFGKTKNYKEAKEKSIKFWSNHALIQE